MTKKQAREPDMTEDGFIVVHSESDIPDFKDEAEEATFWDTHTWSEAMMDKAANEDVVLPPSPERAKDDAITHHSTLIFSGSELSRIERAAKAHKVRTSQFMKKAILEELKREEEQLQP